MTSLTRSVISSLPGSLPSGTLWRLACAAFAITGVIAARACGYQFDVLARYCAYIAFYVALPGVVALQFVMRGRCSLAAAVALGLPTGFAIEIFTFLGLASLDAKELYRWTPIAWALAVGAIRLRRGEWPVRVRVSAHHAGLSLGMALAFLATALMAASQMFAEAPLAAGLPTRAIFHDWVYLVSRAAVIKNHWPLDDPSLSGTPLQYHYFMMVHAAGVSRTTGIEITAVMLRLLYLPMGAVLVAQGYMLGRMVARSPWGGVIAALLMVMASEMSFAPSYGDPMFLGLFVRWLFVSPTFFFGLNFCGALLLVVAYCSKRAHCGPRHYAWLLLLGMAGTGAKGTVLPVLLCALGLWTSWRIWSERRLPVRPILIGLILTAAFAVVYIPTMSSWRTGDASWRPFHVFQLTQFWKQHLLPWQAGLAQWMPRPFAGGVAVAACAAVIFAGTCGIRMLAIPYLFWGDLEKRDRLLVGWIGAFFIASSGMGMLMELNSYGELYLILMMRLPMAVLTAGFLVAVARRLKVWWHERSLSPQGASASPFARAAGMASSGNARAAWTAHLWMAGSALVLVAALGVQTSLWWTRNRGGLREWMTTPTDLKPDAYMQELRDALLWVRRHTEPGAVLVANACTPENMKKDHWGALDRTLTGVHFYYSALSERRLWFEGPNYIMDTTRARIRANMASNFFYRGRPLPPSIVTAGPCYVLVDRSLADGAKVSLPADQKVFSNSRMDIYRLTEALGDGS